MDISGFLLHVIYFIIMYHVKWPSIRIWWPRELLRHSMFNVFHQERNTAINSPNQWDIQAIKNP